MRLLQPSFTTIAEYPAVKAVVAFLAVLFNKLLDSLSGQFLSTVVLLVIFDTITGFAVASKRKKVSSWGWSRSAIKLVNYCVLLSVGKLTSEFLLLAWLNQILVMLIIITEVISILENISILHPRLLPKTIVDMLAVLRING